MNTCIPYSYPLFAFWRESIEAHLALLATTMGVDGLLRQLKEAVLETHLRRYSGQTLVVDAFSWLHKACYGCAFELATGKETDAFVRYMLRKVDLLRSCGVGDVILVFDGDRLPLKAMTHSKRSDSKKENRERAFQSMADANRLHGAARQDEISKAYTHFQRAVSITPAVVNAVMFALRQANVKFVVAPYEADAQMVWMCKAGLASAIVTEDSDVLVYCMAANVDCHVLFKLDDGGMAQALSRQLLHERTATTQNAFLKKVHHLTTGEKDATRMFVQFCALAGCDFLDSLPNMGVVTALKHIFNFRGAPGAVRVQRLLSKLSSSGTKVPLTFYKQFQLTESIFFHHIVFNSTRQTCEFLVDESSANCHADVFARVKEAMGITTSHACLHSLPPPSTPSFMGVIPPRDVMIAIFRGEKCSRTKQPLAQTAAPQASQQPIASNVRPSQDDTNEMEELSPDDVALFAFDEPAPRPAPRKPVIVVDPAAEERRLLQREQQRDATMRSLLNTYGSSQASTIANDPDQDRGDLAIELITRVSSAPTRQLPTAKRALDSVAAPPTTVFSMKELAQRHARDSRPSDTSTGAAVSKPMKSPYFSQIAAAKNKTPESVKKRKLSGTTSTTPAKKPLASGGPSLLHFFHKK